MVALLEAYAAIEPSVWWRVATGVLLGVIVLLLLAAVVMVTITALSRFYIDRDAEPDRSALLDSLDPKRKKRPT